MFGILGKKGHGGRHAHGKKHGHCHGHGHHPKREHRHGRGFDHGVVAGHGTDKVMAHRSFDVGKKSGQENFSINGAACPLCKNHCSASEPGCEKGTAYFDSLNAA